jgi:hypothetical protein
LNSPLWPVAPISENFVVRDTPKYDHLVERRYCSE